MNAPVEHAAENTALAFDIGGTNLRAAIVGHDGTVLAEGTVSSKTTSPEAMAAAAAELAKDLEQQAGVRPNRVGVGLAAMIPTPGDVVANAPNLGWRDVPFRGILSLHLGRRPVRLCNDLDAIALGEARYGAGRGASDLLCVFVGTGVGAGIVAGGHLLTGAGGVAAELGHIKVVLDGGRACGCGARGCLEAYSGGGPLLARVREDIESGAARAVKERAGDEAAHLGHVDALAAEGERYSDALFTDVADLLGLAIGNLLTVLNPGVLVLGGGVLSRCPELMRRVRARIDDVTNAPAKKGLVIEETVLRDRAGLLGAAAAAFEG